MISKELNIRKVYKNFQDKNKEVIVNHKKNCKLNILDLLIPLRKLYKHINQRVQKALKILIFQVNKINKEKYQKPEIYNNNIMKLIFQVKVIIQPKRKFKNNFKLP